MSYEDDVSNPQRPRWELAGGDEREGGCGEPPSKSGYTEEPPPPEPRPWKRPRLRPEDKDVVEEASEESFPASDPPSFTPSKLG